MRQRRGGGPARLPLDMAQDMLITSLSRDSYWLTRFIVLRLLGLVYAVAFLAAAEQVVPLIGAHGLLPVGPFLAQMQDQFGSRLAACLRLPSLFWLSSADSVLRGAAWFGFVLACLVAAGYANAIFMAVLWALYMSFVHVGQDWYGYGWEIQLLETGFLAIFLCPLLDGRPFPNAHHRGWCSGYFAGSSFASCSARR